MSLGETTCCHPKGHRVIKIRTHTSVPPNAYGTEQKGRSLLSARGRAFLAAFPYWDRPVLRLWSWTASHKFGWKEVDQPQKELLTSQNE